MNNIDYVYTWQKERYAQFNKRHLIFKDKLNVKIVSNGYFLPARNHLKYLFGIGGILDANKQYVKESAICTKGGYVYTPDEPEGIAEYLGEGYPIEDNQIKISLDERIVYLGYIDNHWGHFLIDFCTRLWYAKENLYQCNYVFLIKENKNIRLSCQIKRFLELLGISYENILFINQITKCREIVIPEASYCCNYYYSKAYLDIFDSVIANAKITKYDYKKIYFTRKKFGKAKMSEFGEEMLIATFKRGGYHIVSPEQLSLDEQISIISGSDEVAGISGTITHNMLFAKPGQKLTIINKTYSLNIMQFDVNEMRRLETTYVDAYISPFPVSLGIGPFIFVYNTYLKNFLKDNNIIDVQDVYKSYKYVKNLIRKYMRRFRISVYQAGLADFDIDTKSVHYYNNMFMAHSLKDYGRDIFSVHRYELVWYNMLPFLVEKIKRLLGEYLVSKREHL